MGTGRMNSGEHIVAALGTCATSQGAPKILAIGDLRLWRQSFGALPVHQEVHFSSIDDLDEGLLATASPDRVVSPVVTPLFDCIDVAFRIANLSFRGAYRALTRDLPDPRMVRQEVRGLCPDLDFDIVHILDDGLIRF